MIAWTLLAASVAVAFPKAGQQLPFVERCYLIGSVGDGATNVVVQGRDVPVFRTGAWVTMVDCVEGENNIRVGDTNHCFKVARRPKPPAPGAKPKPPKVWKKLDYASDTPQAHPAALGLTPEKMTIVIDAGHGGPSDTGALSPHGIPEKDANLRMAKGVRDGLARLGYRVVMTREADVAVPLYERPRAAHTNGAVAFVSIHHNAPPFDKDPREIRYHAVYAWNALGDRLAGAVNRRMGQAFGQALVNNGVIRANFAVMRNPEIPSCLIEVDFVTTPQGEVDCWDPARRERVAAAIASGIDDWCTGRDVVPAAEQVLNQSRKEDEHGKGIL